MRFYIPGVTTRKEAEGEDAGSDAGNDEQEKNAATLFYETLIDKAEIGETAGDTIATFLDVLHLTPRYASKICDQVHVAFLSYSVRLLMCFKQRSFRYRHVRSLIPTPRQNIRLQDPVRGHQEVHGPS
jgi:hypothetical protein